MPASEEEGSSLAEMIDDSNSSIRAWGMFLIVANAKWGEDNKIDDIIEKYLRTSMTPSRLRQERPAHSLNLGHNIMTRIKTN